MKNKLFLLFYILLLNAFLAPNVFASNDILYTKLTDGYWQLWTTDSTGVIPNQITSSLKDKRTAVWADNGNAVIYRTNNGKLFMIDLKTKHEQELLSKYTYINNPNYSDVKKQVVFVRFDPRGVDLSDIWIADLDGSNSRILTRDRILKYQPKFSKDGNKICYVQASKEKTKHNLWIMDSDGNNRIQLTDSKSFDTLPAFSPDGKYIAYTSNKDGGDYEIYLYDIKKKKDSRLTNNKGLDSTASFSPNGKEIVFVSNRSGNQQLWIMNIDGTNLRQITNGQESIEPVWQY